METLPQTSSISEKTATLVSDVYTSSSRILTSLYSNIKPAIFDELTNLVNNTKVWLKVNSNLIPNTLLTAALIFGTDFDAHNFESSFSNQENSPNIALSQANEEEKTTHSEEDSHKTKQPKTAAESRLQRTPPTFNFDFPQLPISSPETFSKEDFYKAGFVVNERLDGSIILSSQVTDLPLEKEDWYDGKMHNAEIAADQIEQIGELEPGDSVALLKNGIIHFDENSGYRTIRYRNPITGRNELMTGGGACYTVTIFGTLHDDVNADLERAGLKKLFTFKDGSDLNNNNPHGKEYNTYNGKGYMIYDGKNGYRSDYIVGINTDFKIEGYEVKVTFELKAYGNGSKNDNNGMTGRIDIELIPRK